MSDTAVDPGDLSMREEEARKDGRKRFKKLTKGAPGEIRMTNKQGLLSQGTRAVMFVDEELPDGLDDEEAADFEQELIESAAAENDEDNDGTAEWAVAGLSATEQLNLYFSHRANRTLAEIYPSADGRSLLCFIDVFLSGEDLDDFQEHSEELVRLLGEKRRQRAEAKEKEAQEKLTQEQRDKADLELGRKVREHNVIEKAREAEEKLKAIRKAANRLAQKHGEKGWDEDVE